LLFVKVNHYFLFPMTMRLIKITTLEALRANSCAWDDLWWRSDATLPAMRAELLAQWIERFAPRRRFCALGVEDQGQWVAALPLVQCRVARLIPAGGLPSNEWSSSGDLLLDRQSDAESVLDLLVSGMSALGWPLLWLDEALLDAPRWIALHEALLRAKVSTARREHYRVARIEIGDDWEVCQSRWSRKHRQKMSWAMRQLQRRGDLRHVTLRDLPPEAVEPPLRQGFDIEDSGWKGRSGSSVLRTPGMFPFFLRQAQQLARWDQLELHFLQSAGQTIAFTYGMAAKGAFHSCKIGYDPEFGGFSPGQLLRYYMLRQFHGDSRYSHLDCQGPLTDAHSTWRPALETIGRMAIAPGPMAGRAFLGACARLFPHLDSHRNVVNNTMRQEEHLEAVHRSS
jgi:CelD/BcsL family acetyltransferase involved in cellulose biosynthesis